MKNFMELRQAALPRLRDFHQQRVRRLPEGEIAECLVLKRAHLSRVKSGSHNLTRAQQIILQYLCSNTAIDQYAERITAEIAEATETPADTIARLQSELAQARRAA